MPSLPENERNERERLQAILEGCRDDMHEPDEQGAVATISGDHLDNAFGDVVDPVAKEFVVSITRDGKTEHFNLANLIALARY